MYTLVLMAALSNGSTAPEFFGHGHHHGCQAYPHVGCYHSCNCWGWYGGDYCTYCVGHHCYMCYGCHCYGSYITWSCHGCYNGYACYAAPLTAPIQGPVNVTPAPNTPLPQPLPEPGVELPKKAIELPPIDPKTLPKIDPKAFPKTEEKPISTDGSARVIVELPQDARLFVDGRPTTTNSERRVFRTPALEGGHSYYYELRAEVERNGNILSQTRRVILRRGETVQASFSDLQPQPDATAAQR